MTPETRIRVFVPVYIDEFQSATYRHVLTTADGSGLFAHFADGSIRPSIYTTVDAMLAAGATDWREQMREIAPGQVLR